jgi:putative transposase
MSHASVYVHFVFTTKNRQPFLDSFQKRQAVWFHIKDYAMQSRIHLEVVNGYTDHCHCLVSMSRQQTLGEIMNRIKGESSHWINKNSICEGVFQWQSQYFAISVSQSIVQKVRNYILNQENHHKKKDFEHEYNLLVREHGFKITNFD